MRRDHGLGFAIALNLVFLAVGTRADAFVDHTGVFTAPKTTTAPSSFMPGSDPALQKALKATNFYDYTARRPAQPATTAYFLYDDVNLYVVFNCDQAGIPITAAQTTNDTGVGSDDNVEFLLDTTGNGTRTYSFSATPKGIHSETSSENTSYAPHWTSVAQTRPDGGWDVAMTIPLSDIHAQGSPVQRWRFNFVRFTAATNTYDTWAYEPTQTSVFNSTSWPVLDGVQIAARAARPGPRADLYTLASAGSDHNQFQNTQGSVPTEKAPFAGLDAVYPITNPLSAVGTLNPDFSNVEADQTVISPQEFQRNLAEFRPFFAQGAQYLNTIPGINVNTSEILFYTPSIGTFNNGLKVEGTAGMNGIGALHIAGDGFADSAVGYSYSNAGTGLTGSYQGVYADHDGVRDDTSAFGFGSVNPRSGVSFVANTYLESGSLVGDPGLAHFDTVGAGIQNARITSFLAYKDVGPDFDPIDSLTQINDIRGPQFLTVYTGGAFGAVNSYSVTVVGDRLLDRSGAVHDADAIGAISATFKNQLSLSLTQANSELSSYVDAF